MLAKHMFIQSADLRIVILGERIGDIFQIPIKALWLSEKSIGKERLTTWCLKRKRRDSNPNEDWILKSSRASSKCQLMFSASEWPGARWRRRKLFQVATWILKWSEYEKYSNLFFPFKRCQIYLWSWQIYLH